MNIVKILFIIIWTLWCLVGIFKNFTHYKFYDWIIALLVLVVPYGISWLVSKKIKSNKNATKSDLKTNYPCSDTVWNENSDVLLNITECTFSDYMGMKIVPNTYPAKDGYNCLNENEKIFFQEFYQQLIAAKLSPYLIKLTRLSNGEFNVDYTTLCYVGKINLYQSPASYLAIKRGNKRATKIFHTLQEAETYISQKEEYSIEVRQPKDINSMQYLRGASTIKNLSNLSVEQCIEYIPYWIRYIKYCKRN